MLNFDRDSFIRVVKRFKVAINGSPNSIGRVPVGGACMEDTTNHKGLLLPSGEDSHNKTECTGPIALCQQ
jgi:hypothetical protein